MPMNENSKSYKAGILMQMYLEKQIKKEFNV